MIKVYAESKNHAELWATFEDEALYIQCLPILEAQAHKDRMIITESVEEVDDTDNANHVITIVWGAFEAGSYQTETYAFDTEKDKEMFLLGVDAACGYLDYEIEGE